YLCPLVFPLNTRRFFLCIPSPFPGGHKVLCAAVDRPLWARTDVLSLSMFHHNLAAPGVLSHPHCAPVQANTAPLAILYWDRHPISRQLCLPAFHSRSTTWRRPQKAG